MLPTFVIGLREGLEAALIVGIVAAFLRQRGRLDLVRWVFVGVTVAVALCVAVGVTLDLVSRDLPQRQQEGLETVVGLVAVSMVTYMVVWMHRHARELKGQLEASASAALAAGSGWALVLMAFLAVLREGFETVVFLLAAFNEAGSGKSPVIGALLGIVTAVLLGWAIYRGGVRINLARFFRITGFVLVLVAAGLFVTALHTAHEAGWLNAGQQSTVDLSSLVAPGSVRSSLLTGILGIQSKPVLIEVVGWLVYLIPVGLYVLLPAGRRPRPSTLERAGSMAGAVCVVAAIVLFVLAPSRPPLDPVTTGAAGVSAQVETISGDTAVVRISTGPTTAASTERLQRTANEDHLGIASTVYSLDATSPVPGRSDTITYAELAARNGGRLPIGARATDVQATVTLTYEDHQHTTAWIDPRDHRVLDVQTTDSVTTVVALPIGPTPIGDPETTAHSLLSESEAGAAAAKAADAAERRSSRQSMETLAVLAVVVGVGVLVAAGLSVLSRRRRDRHVPPAVVEESPMETQLATRR